ncbi:MAG: GTP pyrophosphokinase family protein [Oligoflexales bacterium]
MKTDVIIDDYSKNFSLYQQLQSFVSDYLGSLLKHNNLKVHSLTSRIKAAESLKAKVARPDKTYEKIHEIKDICALRVVTYFEDAIEQIASVIEANFKVDLTHSIDKRRILDSSQFGYNSLHYVVTLPSKVAAPPQLQGVPIEIQIRTILQHAWAEIEHDLGYKSEESVPSHIRRRFSRLAGLLEIADEEFVAIKKYLKSYEQDLSTRIAEKSQTVTIDALSLSSFIDSSVVDELDSLLAQELRICLEDNKFFIEYLIKILSFVGLKSICDIESAIYDNKGDLPNFISCYFKFTEKAWKFSSKNLDRFLRGYSLFFLGHLLAHKMHTLEIKKLETLSNFYQCLDYPNDKESAKRVASLFVETMRDQTRVHSNLPINRYTKGVSHENHDHQR